MEGNPKIETLNPKQDQSIKVRSSKRFDLEERSTRFAKRVIVYIHKLPKTMTNLEIGRQLIRSAGSIGANYIEANECLSRKDFALRIKISRKEARETRYWLDLTEPLSINEKEKALLTQEVTELMKIFGAIVVKCLWFYIYIFELRAYLVFRI